MGWVSLVVGACNKTNSGDPDAESSVRAEAPLEDIVSTKENLYSQHGEELIIRDFFQDRRDGVFLDVGAAWPVHYSNTYYLESELGWLSSVNYPSRSATTRISVTYLLIFLRYIAAKWQCPLRGPASGSGQGCFASFSIVRSRRRGHGAGGADRGSSK